MKERFEWINSWCDEADKGDLPRVLLVGDSITNSYQSMVREELRGICYVDHIATSYTFNNQMFFRLITDFVSNSDYKIIHFNQGLHGFPMSKSKYQSKYEKTLSKIMKGQKIILSESTLVKTAGNKKIDKRWDKKVKERNEAIRELAAKYGFSLDELYDVSASIKDSDRNEDGIHYLEGGCRILANSVAGSIKKVLFK